MQNEGLNPRSSKSPEGSNFSQHHDSQVSESSREHRENKDDEIEVKMSGSEDKEEQ